MTQSSTLDKPVTTATATATEETTSLLAVDGLTVRYETRHGVTTAVDDVSLRVARGERVALVGESGSGKTGTCMAVAGFLTHPDARVEARSILFDGDDVTERRAGRLPRRTPGLAMVFQDASTSLDPVWTIGSQLRDVIRTTRDVSRGEARARAADWLVKVGLTDTKRVLRSRPYELSGGMRQRAMIALALAGSPRLLIADEPTSALDASLARDVMELLVALAAETGTGMLLVSHDIHLCQTYTDRMLVMYGGRVVEEGASRTLDRDAAHPYTRALLDSVPTLASATLDVLPTIPLAPTGQHDPAGGCGFRPRCARATDACATPPARTDLGAGRAVRCFNPAATTTGPVDLPLPAVAS
ncbi:ABC transporter ATP-binding protein [Nocardioides sp. C4-1]|uniref:ABC transporter ATP-binding protein n=1 Tax=Nocardioides sp. C4-1 TaxID=3151851 RepID=UPI003267C155